MLPLQPSSSSFKTFDLNGPKKQFPDNLPHKVHETIGGFLSDNDQEAYRQINSHAYLISEFITQKKLNKEAAPVGSEPAEFLNISDLTALQRTAPPSEQFISLVGDNHLTVAHPGNLTPARRQLMAQPVVQEFLRGPYVETEMIPVFDGPELAVLNLPSVQKNILNNFLSVNDVINLNAQQILNLNNPVIQKYIDNGKLSKIGFLRLNQVGIANLEMGYTQYAIDTNQLSINLLAQGNERSIILPVPRNI